MNPLVRSQNLCFPLSSLPDDVVLYLAQYLSPRQIGIMARLNRHFRKIFNSPHLWRYINLKIRLHDRKIASEAIEILKVRGIRNLEFENMVHSYLKPYETKTVQPLLCPHLEKLTFKVTTQFTLEALYNAASQGKLNLRRLAFGTVDIKLQKRIKRTFEEVLKSLPSIEEVSFGRVDVNDLAGSNPLADDVQRALCCSGKLTSISLVCQESLEMSWLKAVVSSNPHLRKLCLSLIWLTDYGEAGELQDVEQGVLSSLETFELHVRDTYHNSRRLTNHILDWAFPSNKVPYENLTSLDVTCPHNPIMFTQLLKFPALKRLNLTGSFVPKEQSLWNFPNFQTLEWLELNSCRGISGDQLHFLSQKVGKTLCYLGLAQIPMITNNNLRELAIMFPVLRTLDLSACSRITDALLVEWYIKHNRNEWPKLRKLILKGCEEISVDVVNSVRLKTRNQLLVDL